VSRARAKEPLPPGPSREPAWLRIAIIAAAAVLLTGLFSTEIGDPDFWWHLKTGQYVLEHRALPVPDPFSYTSNSGAPAYPGEEQTRYFNLTHEWLAQAMLYSIYSAAGFPGIVFCRALLLATFCAVVGILAARRRGSFLAGLLAAFAAVPIATMYAADRPFLITFLLLAVFVAALEFRRGLWLLPPLAIIWANCHGGFFLGWIVLAAYSVEAAILRRQGRAPADAMRVWLVSASAIAASGLNPNGLRVLETLIHYRESVLTSTLFEWKSPSLWGPPYTFDILLFACALVLALSWRKVRYADWILFAAFAAAALSALRNVMLIAFLAPILIAAYFPWRIRFPRFSMTAALAVLVSGIAAGAVEGRLFRFGVEAWRFPQGACDFLLARKIAAPLFNTYGDGGYMIWRLWPLQRVFIDGRALNESVYQDYLRVVSNTDSVRNKMTGPRNEVLSRHGVRVMVTNSFEYVTGAVYPLVLALGDPGAAEWKLIYDDPQSLIFYLNPPPEIPVFEDKSARVITHMETECAQYVEHAPLLPECARSLAEVSAAAGDIERARRMLALYLGQPVAHSPRALELLRQLPPRPEN
jgi:hypothetical protein